MINSTKINELLATAKSDPYRSTEIAQELESHLPTAHPMQALMIREAIATVSDLASARKKSFESTLAVEKYLASLDTADTERWNMTHPDDQI